MTKKLTIKDIAEMTQTSKTTVSFFLNGKYEKMSQGTREKIEQVIQETNYKPSIVARSLNSKTTKLIGVLIGDITNSFSNQIVKGIEDIASQNGYQVIIGNSDYKQENEDNYIESMLLLGVDGFIIQPTSTFRKYSRIIEEKKKKMVFFDSQLYEHRTSWVKTNNYDAVYDAIQNCVTKGYEDFVMITADTSRISTRIERASGFIDALNDANIEHDLLIIEDKQTELENIRNFLKGVFEREKRTLVFAPNCWALPLVFTAMKELDYDSSRIGLIGFDNTEWTDLSSPRITTIVQPAFEEGQQATKILIDQIEGKHQEEKQQVLDCAIHWKESTV
ncbi:LacI family DNA-binding transcriptional regulator [Tuanshanicoccus lijuaniae]|uniref:LacI family DNA-binding transcriptional regulator n=1 Tax=Aerococcaceae bacterium zg-1292 TaxID=2774330 RepID=UPI00193599B9|nr:LacI family DNA-binding transcriptional regulator [Aerococcaceae bacterium zg-1292]MBF6626443.1 LacI family DNA-binding transcriptional regulator [Aerococcaceae bacterium zg-BR9]MBF6979192.1 LacI family DNA-binding transcriptional regulator [Aerococcaceae bacterium zg-BR22]MBS4455680.1 LacI family DNA-binding transcriptional regulator [Aerococcaceae bacterium zg-A91]MBS4457431.1 LacI family DNA-binding transcriptional regulator [Aerococcaceae bacterium zg-BR33]